MKSLNPDINLPLKRNIYPMIDWNIFLKEGKKEFDKFYNNYNAQEYDKNDFELIRVLGGGSFGKVYLAELRKTGEQYALKEINKFKIVKSSRKNHILQEQKILQALNFPFCIYQEMSFQNKHYYYLCLPYIPGGNLLTLLNEKEVFEEDQSKFYGAQIILALEYLHYLRIVHRDVKPENIVIDLKGYIKLIDFGFSKKISDNRFYTFCGTPDYLAPEIILQKGYGKSVDWWSFGVFLFEMSAGYTPFKASDVLMTYEKATDGAYEIPHHFSGELADLIKHLLQVDLSRRFGNLKGGADDIKYHPWFSSTDWAALFNNSMPAPYIPNNNEPIDYWKNLNEKLKTSNDHSRTQVTEGVENKIIDF